MPPASGDAFGEVGMLGNAGSFGPAACRAGSLSGDDRMGSEPASKKLLSQVLVAQGIDEGGSFSFTQRTLVWATVGCYGSRAQCG
jgi:hypothetical protein